MPADIRSFFGGKTDTPIREKATKKEEEPKKKKNKSRKVIEDSDDEEPVPPPKKSTPKPAPSKKAAKNESIEGKETTASDYFASSSKPKVAKSTPIKSKPLQNSQANGRSSARKSTATSYVELDDEEAFLDDDVDAGDDIFAADARKAGKRKDDAYVELDSDDEPIVVAKKSTAKPTKKAAPIPKITKSEDVEMKDVTNDKAFVVDDDDEESDGFMMLDEPTVKGSKKRKSVDLDSDEDEEEEDIKPKSKSTKSKSAKQPPAKKARAPAAKKNEPESSAIKAILDSIPTVRAPTPPPKDGDALKFDWRKGGAPGGGNAGPPPGAGSKDIPSGEENCLVGLTFVFTGLLESLSREEGQELVKRYGGKVTGAPSGKTSYVVLGNDAGPSKLKKIRDMNIKTINEDGLFELIRLMPANGGDGKAAEKNLEKKKAEMDKIKADAEEMEREEQRKVKEAAKAAKEAQKRATLQGSSAPAPAPKPVPSSSLLWTSRYAPTAMNQICGNKGAVDKISKWLNGWALAHKYNFQKKGPEGLGGYRAIIIHGPPGIGKTTAAHLAAKLAGYDTLESNASDARSKKLVEAGVNEVMDNTSLLGFFAGAGKELDKKKKKLVLIMDEVDGMSSGDRGGVGALAKVCKKTDIPMILICNERRLPKMRPFDNVTLDVPFRRPTVEQVRSRIMTICHREGLKIPVNAIDALIEGSNKDIRQIVNMLSTIKLDQSAIDFDQGKSMSKAWEKHVVLKPWDICTKLLGGGMFAPSSKSTINDKVELYFNDHEFSYLMIQENYLHTKPSQVTADIRSKEGRLKDLQLAEMAAQSISDGDLVDRMIHGSQQQWSLMPTHAILSTVIPCSYRAGQLTGRTDFTTWLGNNSKAGKLSRYVKEIQSHMRLRCSGDRHEIRQQYLPLLWTQMIKKLEVEGKECVDEVIDLMDSYFLTRDDFDFIQELGLGPMDEANVKIETQTKATFTRLYNQRSHPLPFMKASNAALAPAKASKDAPDLEEAFEEDDDADVVAEPKEEDEGDLSKDKYIKKPKAKKAAGKKAAPKKKATKKGAAKDEEEEEEEEDGDSFLDDDEEEEVKPKKKAKAKPKSKAAATAKGKGKK